MLQSKCYTASNPQLRKQDKSLELNTYTGARYRVRTCDPYRVKILWPSEQLRLLYEATLYGAMQTHMKTENATVVFAW